MLVASGEECGVDGLRNFSGSVGVNEYCLSIWLVGHVVGIVSEVTLTPASLTNVSRTSETVL